VQVIFTGEKMAAAIDKLGQKVAESCPNTVQGEDEHILAGSTSTIMPVNHPFFACLWRTMSFQWSPCFESKDSATGLLDYCYQILSLHANAQSVITERRGHGCSSGYR
jgi:hypothetical protein